MEARRKFDAQFKEGAVRIVRETGKPMRRGLGPPGSAPIGGGMNPSSRNHLR